VPICHVALLMIFANDTHTYTHTTFSELGSPMTPPPQKKHKLHMGVTQNVLKLFARNTKIP